MAKPYQFTGKGKVKHGAYHEVTGHTYKIPAPVEPPPPATWSGKPIGSVQEWRFILALLDYELPFEFQVPVAGGRTRRGGLVLDFMVYTKPLFTPVSIIGEYWHSGENALDDELRERTLMKEYKGMIKPLVKVKDYELPDVDTAKQVVRREMITG